MLCLIEKLISEESFRLPVKRTLVVDFNYLGDMLMSSPVYRVIASETVAPVDVLALDFCAPVLRANPCIDQIYLLKDMTLWTAVKTCLQMWGRYNLVLQLNTSLRTNFLMFLTGAKYRLGYNYRHRGCFNNIRVPIQTRTAKEGNRVNECLSLLEKGLGWKSESKEMIFFSLPPVDLFGKKKIAAFHTNTRTTQDLRRWPYFPELADRLEGYTIAFTGSLEDRPYIDGLRVKMKGPSLNLGGIFTVEGLAVFLNSCSLVVSVNSFPMHLARALNVPTVAIVGATPAEVVCNPSSQFRYIENMNLSKVTVEEVLHEIELLTGG